MCLNRIDIDVLDTAAVNVKEAFTYSNTTHLTNTQIDKYVGSFPVLPQKCYKSLYDVRQLGASAEKLSIRVCR